MSSATFLNNCPYPGCSLDQEHEGNHVPRMHLVQRYRLPSAPYHPGFCKVGECCGVAVALYSDREGKGLEVCAKCEAELIANGWLKLGMAVSA